MNPAWAGSVGWDFLGICHGLGTGLCSSVFLLLSVVLSGRWRAFLCRCVSHSGNTHTGFCVLVCSVDVHSYNETCLRTGENMQKKNIVPSTHSKII